MDEGHLDARQNRLIALLGELHRVGPRLEAYGNQEAEDIYRTFLAGWQNLQGLAVMGMVIPEQVDDLVTSAESFLETIYSEIGYPPEPA